MKACLENLSRCISLDSIHSNSINLNPRLSIKLSFSSLFLSIICF